MSSILKEIISKRDLSSLTMKDYLKPTLKDLTPNPWIYMIWKRLLIFFMMLF